MIQVGDSVILRNLEPINALYSLNLTDARQWLLTKIIAKAPSTNPYTVNERPVVNNATFLLILTDKSQFNFSMPFTLAEFEMCCSEIIPLKRERMIPIC